MNFNTTVVGQGRFADGVEDYFCLQGLSKKPMEKAFVYASDKKGYEVVRLKDAGQQSKWLLAVKIVSFMTVFVPLMMLMLKACIRAANRYKTGTLADVAQGKMSLSIEDKASLEEGIRAILHNTNGSPNLGLYENPNSKYSFKIYKENSEEAVDHNIEAIGFMHMVAKIKKCANIIIPHAVKFSVNYNGNVYSVVVQEKIDVEKDKSAMDSMLTSSKSTTQALSRMLLGSGGEISYNDIDLQHGSQDQLVIRNGEESIPDFLINDASNLNKRKKLNYTHRFLNTAPKDIQDKMLNAIGVRTEVVFDPLDPKIAGTLYRQLKVISKIFRENGIRFWLSSGTYLGYVRHDGIIPWDDDIDIQVHHEDREKILGLASEFAKYGLLVHDQHKEKFSIKVCEMCDPKTNYAKSDYPAVDIFTAKQDGDYFYFGYENARKAWPEDRWHKDDIANLKRVKFGPGIDVYVPNSPNLAENGNGDDNYYLRENYGKDWYYLAYRIWNHAERRSFKKEEVFIQDHKPVDFDADVAQLDQIV